MVNQSLLLSNINIECLETQCLLHCSSVSIPCGEYYFWGILVFLDLHYPSFFSTCGKCKLNFDDDDDSLMYMHYSLWYLQTGPFVFILIFTFPHNVLCIFNLDFSPKVICFNVASALVDSWEDFRYTGTSRHFILQNIRRYLPLIICQCLQYVIADRGWLSAVFLKWQLIIERPLYLTSKKYNFSPGSL